jgi:hypothetical protein
LILANRRTEQVGGFLLPDQPYNADIAFQNEGDA